MRRCRTGCKPIRVSSDVADRRFDTTAYPDHASDLEGCLLDPEGGDWYHIESPPNSRCKTCGHRMSTVYYWDSIVIAVDGGCRNNGTRHAEAAYAAYFSDSNIRYNTSSLLDGPQTNQRAELTAALLALNLAYDIKNRNNPRRRHQRYGGAADGPEATLARVVVKSDSDYLVKGMTRWIYKWKQNGYLNARNRPVVNGDLFQAIDNSIGVLNNRGVQVQFWHVPREQNTMADYLVNSRLDGLTAEEAMENCRFWEEDSEKY